MSSRGALGALQQKPRPQNVNSVYSGKNTAAGKASGPSKQHGGLQALGKTTTIVRRMPPPATLPSLKSEYADDPCLVPAGGQGWSKSNQISDNGNQKLAHSASASDFKTNGGEGSAETSSLLAMAGGPDLRPNWAKPAQATGNTSSSQASQGAPTALSDVQSQAAAASVQTHQPTPPPTTAAEAANNREFPTLAASAAVKSSATAASVDYGSLKPQKNWASGMGQAQAEAEDMSAFIVPVTTTALSSSAGYIGASMPRTVPDRKLPDRYCGAVTRQNSSQQKYDWQEKMARLSLESKEQKSVVSPANAPTGTDKSAQQVDVVKPELVASAAAPTERALTQRAVPQDYQQPPPPAEVQDARLYYQQPHTPASDSTGGGAVPIQENHQKSFGGEQQQEGKELDQRRNAPIGQPPVQHQRQYSSGPHPSGRQDIGYAMGQPPTDPQHQSARPYDKPAAVRGGFEYGGAPTQHHRYDEPPPAVMGAYAPPSFRRSAEAPATEPDIFEEATSRRYTASSPTPPTPMGGGGSWGVEDHKVQSNRYRLDSRHTSESDSGWYGPLNNMQHHQHQPAYNARRGGSNYQPDQHNSWYSSTQPAAPPANYPPSLLSLDTTAPAEIYGEERSQGRTNYNASSNYYQPNPPNPRSRNGSITYASEEGTRAFKGKPPNRRALGTELSSASENDSQYEPAGPTPYSTTKNDSSFFGGNEPVDKTYWNERSSQHQQPIQPQQQQRGSTGKPEPAPMIRMLKRNDEKSAEYFAHHATVLTTSQEMVNEQKQQEEQEEDDEFNATIPLTQLSQHTRSNNYNRREVPGETGKQARPQTASHPQNKGNFQATEDLSGQNYSSSHKKHSQNGVGGKFNRAPGGSGKSNAPQANNKYRQPDVDQQEKRPSKSPSPGTPNSDANKPAATVALAQPPVDNVWEKRKEEREKPSATYPQSKPSRQFDYHFPSMSDAAKQEALDAAAASAAADTPELFRSQQQQQSRHQDVRFEQQQSTRGEVGGQWGRHASSNQWNPRTATQTESHWNDDDFSSGNKDGNRKQQRSNNYKNKSNEPGGDGGARLDNHNIFDASDNTYEGNRREFVNSSKTTRNTLNGSSATQRKPLRGSTNKQGGGNRSQPTRATEDASYTSNRQVGNKQAKQQQRGQLQPATTSTTGAVVTDQSGSQLLRPNAKESGLKSQPEERDNFSNMDVFHAEDYHIESPKDGSHPTANADFTSESAGGGVKRGSLPARRVNKRTAAQANPHYANETSERSQPRSGNRGGRSSANAGVFVNKSWRSEAQPNNTRPLNSNNNTEHQPSSDVPNDGQELCADKGQTSVNKAGPQKRDNARFSTTATQQQHPRGGVSRLGQRNPNKATRYKADINNSANNASSSSRQPSDRAGQLKSPVISDGGGAEEWETASESSDFAERIGRVEEEPERPNQSTKPPTRSGFDRKENTKKPMGNASRNTNTGRRAQPKLGNGDSNTAIADQQNFSSTTNTAKAQQIRSAGQKNVKPASHTYQGSSAKSNNNNRARSAVYTHEQHQSNNTKNAREDRKGSDVPKNGASNHYSARDGLAGVDINNASVIIIDNHPDRFLNNSVGGSRDELEVDDFEEVLSKKSKRQRLLQLEEERKKEQREKEKQEKIQEKILAKRAKQQQQHRRKTEKGTSVLQPEVSPNVLINTENKKDCTSGKNEGETVSELGSSALMLSTALFNTNSSCTVSKSSNVSPNTAKTTGGLVNGLAGSSLHDVTSETVWNNSHTLNTLDDFSSTPSGPVIPSPIARPIRVLNDSIRKSSTYSSSKSLTAIEKPELDFTNYDSLKASGGGGSQPTKGGSSSDSKSPIACGEEESNTSGNHHRQNSNDDHAQLQKKLDKVKNFWSGSMSTDQPVDSQHQNGVQNNSAKEVQVGTTDASTTISSTNSSCIAASNEAQRQQQTSSNNHSSGAGMLPPFSGGQRQPGSVRAKANAMESFPSTTANTPQSPITSNLFGNAIFTLGGGPSGTTNTQLAAYSIMMGNNGEQQQWFTAPPPTHPHQHHHHPANSPTNSQQQILSNAANQRSSRPTSFVEHGFHTAATPWSTNSGLEFLQGISATPPPMSGPTPVLFQQQPAKNFSQQPPPSLRMSSSTHPSGLLAVGHPPVAALQQVFAPPNNMIRATQLAHTQIHPPSNLQQMGSGTHFMPPPSAPLDWSMPPPQFFPPPNSRSQHMPSAYAAVPPPAAQPTINMFSTPPPPFPHQPVPTMNGMAATNGSAFGRNFVRPAAATQPPLYYSSNGAVEQQKRQPLIFNNKSQHNQLQSTSPEGNQQRNNSQDGSKKSPNSANCGAEIVNASSTANPNSGYGLFK